MKAKDISKIELEVRTQNTAAIKFYQKHGFIIQEAIPKFYNTGDDAYLMQKIL
jgi:ribosomal protein S18 acetylase RimI-like enzyme